ncbi:MAG TPA: hypothetical protein VMT03_23480 [Polyangia bacterium]|nr:hypothetical protein [Polyangia bacterium]
MSVTNVWGANANEASLVESWFAEGEAASEAQAAAPEVRVRSSTRGLWPRFGGAAVALVLVVVLAIAFASQ